MTEQEEEKTSNSEIARDNEDFSGEEGEKKSAKKKSETMLGGTLFIIENAWGYDIEPYSIFQGEKEILLEPERMFEVVSVVDGDEFTVINLKMVNTPTILEKVFGKRRK